MIIAIDGPAGAGKGTLAKTLAQRLQFTYLDTGLLFRAVALKAKKKDISADQEDKIAALARHLQPLDWQQEGLRSFQMAQAASIIAAYPGVRQALKEVMQSFAQSHKQQGQGAILDGRDIGTVICPQAEIKLYVTASFQERAQRRFKELQLNGFEGTLAEVLSDIKRRDERDQSRALAPLKPAKDAFIIDTTSLSPQDVLTIALNYILKSHPDQTVI